MNPLVTTQWLADHLRAPDVRIVDASWYLPDMKRDAKAEYAEAHIPGAVFFDLDDISDTASPYPHTLPPPEKFASRMKKLGLGDGHRIVAYDGAGLFSAARAWWMLRAMGHEEVFVLDGGFPKWRAEGRPIDDMPPVPQARHFTPRPNHLILRDANQVLENLKTKRDSAKRRCAGRRLPRRRYRHDEARHRQLRLRRHCRHHRARTQGDGRSRCSDLRRLVGRMGLAP
jgi:thiosulfate/3-mercaptopyruvate sulfurtransferase